LVFDTAIHIFAQGKVCRENRSECWELWKYEYVHAHTHSHTRSRTHMHTPTHTHTYTHAGGRSGCENVTFPPFWSSFLSPFLKIVSTGPRSHEHRDSFFFFFSLLCRHTASPPIASRTHTDGLQYYGNKEDQKRLTSSNGTPALDLGHMNVALK